jgi:hypothetical protein
MWIYVCIHVILHMYIYMCVYVCMYIYIVYMPMVCVRSISLWGCLFCCTRTPPRVTPYPLAGACGCALQILPICYYANLYYMLCVYVYVMYVYIYERKYVLCVFLYLLDVRAHAHTHTHTRTGPVVKTTKEHFKKCFGADVCA